MLVAIPTCRFQELFSMDDTKAPRMWGPRDDIPAIAQRARLAAAGVLAQLAVLRPPPGQPGQHAAEAGEGGEGHLAKGGGRWAVGKLR